VSCATPLPNINIVGVKFPTITGNRLGGLPLKIEDFSPGKIKVILIGIVQRAQIDIDYWISSLKENKVTLPVIELMVLNSWLPNVQAGKMQDKVGDGVDENFLKLVVMNFDEAAKTRNVAGKSYPENARVLLLNKDQQVIFQHDSGYSSESLEKLLELMTKKILINRAE